MATGKENITENLLDEIIIGRDIPPEEAGPAPTDVPAEPDDGKKVTRKTRRARNTVFDDRGPRVDPEAPAEAAS